MIDACRRQIYRPLEVIVVVGPCTDGTEQFVATLRDVKVCRVDRLVLAHARNEGLRAAAGDVVAFMDDDAIPSPRWLEEVVQVYQREGPDCAAVGGAVINECARSRPLQFRYGIVNDLGDTDDVRLEPGTANARDGAWFNRLMGTNMTFRRGPLLAVGGFDENFLYLHDDTDICVTLIRAGYRVVQHGRAVIHHFPARGHNRRSDYELNWFDIIRSSTYFALKHSRQGGKPALRAVLRRHKHLLPQFARWWMNGEVTLGAYLRFSTAWVRGLVTGIRQGRARRRAAPPAALSAGRPPGFLSLQPAAAPRDQEFSLARPSPCPRVGTLKGGRGLRIALVCGDFGTQPGGIAMYTQHLAESLAGLGHSVVVLRAGWGKCQLPPRGYEVVDIPIGHIQAASLQSALYQTFYELSVTRPFDVVEAPLWNGEGCAVGMSTACPLVVRLETPSEVIRQLSDLPFDPQARSTIAAERLELSYASGAVAISKAIWKTVENVYELQLQTHARKGVVIPLGLPGADSLDLRSIPYPDRGGPKFLYVGRLEARKGPLELAEAFARVAAEIPDATLWVVGADNSANDGFYRRTGSTYVDKLRSLWSPEVAGRVQFFGSVSEAEKNYLYSRCDVFVAPSRYESFGLIFLEAMRFGKPAIGTDAGGIPEIVGHGSTGLLVPVESAPRLAEAMLTLGGDGQLRRDYGAAGRERFEAEFTLHRCALRTEQFYREVKEAWDGAGEAELEQVRREVHGSSARAA